jgi:hypothetical protein
MLRIGYAYSRSASATKPSIDHIPTIEATSRLGIACSSNGHSRQDPLPLTPYINTEIFCDWRYDKANEVRYASGLEWSIVHFLLFD